MSALCKVAGLSHREEGTVRSIHRDLVQSTAPAPVCQKDTDGLRILGLGLVLGASLWRCSRHTQSGRDPWVDPDYGWMF